ncbi:unnamed protein product [Schistosoma intercalatum]|nr:unnamed protein product [Schistosoma intercalatum]CAH8597840.1 unnamed protein product [Schistosoma intercalatum]
MSTTACLPAKCVINKKSKVSSNKRNSRNVLKIMYTDDILNVLTQNTKDGFHKKYTSLFSILIVYSTNQLISNIHQ